MIRTFRDNEELYKSGGKWPNLLKVIGQSKISVIILSPRYAESKWCLKELADIIEHHNREKGHIILPIFYMVHPQDVRRQTGPYEEAFKQHETNDIDEETIRSWKNALNEVGRLKGWHISSKKKYDDVADAVYEVVRSHLSKKNNKLETDELVGIDDQVDEVVDMLDLDSQGVKVVGLHGKSGIGKTTLATTVYNKVSAYFDQYSFVKDIREIQKEQDGVLVLQKNLISDILRMDSVESIVEAKKIIRERVAQFKILVVLEDVDEKFNFEEVLVNSKSFTSGSRFIVTSRDIKVLRRLSGGQSKLYKVQGMNLIHSLQLFCKHAFKKYSPQSGFEALSNAIISTTGGLPLTLKVIGSLLYQEEEVVWKEKLEQLRKIPEEEQRSMLEIGDDNVFLMHDQFRDMGREIVRREDIERPWMRSRIWSYKEAHELLRNNKGTDKLKAIRIENTHFSNVDLESTCFTNMSELRYFHGKRVKLIGDFNHLLPNLKWMRLGNHYDEDLLDRKATINVKSSNILEVSSSSGYDFTHMKEAHKLKVLILEHCSKMSKLP
ncbi:Disease resistance protein L6 [Linum perenne]